ncbi:ABC transporter permease subunit [Candidatus Symbiopectobacterium sp. NZEC151]|uniref:ABC transporter permease subunit n=2 Tax=unclassified Symbiopectobacterium TaxID=2794573 RepID=UPI002226B260|nr:ABC transporter permease subunit [Candidatus Symbiopectobacterium sp. NZEC151]MCW2473754.1 ABC transporter permease subunit [Candidatus Symbiopectobacterium sp. NZEC151]
MMVSPLRIGAVIAPLVSRALSAFAVIALIGLLPWLSGSDPALSVLRAKSAEQEATPEALQAIRSQLGLDQGPLALLWQWWRGILQGDAGHSWISGKPVLPAMVDAAGVSLTLMGAALTLAILVATLLCVSTLRNGLRGKADSSHGAWAMAFTTLPEYLLASLLLMVGAVWLPLFPPYGWHGVQHLVLPALSLGLPAGGLLARLLADALRSTFAEPWLITWRVAGISQFDCAIAVLRRALPALLPQIGFITVGLTGGAVAVEKIFAIPGLGRATLGASAAQDLPALQCGVLLLLLIATVSGTLGNLLRQLILGRALRSGSLPAPTISPMRRPHYAFPIAIALILALLIAVGLTRDPLASDFLRLQPPSLALPLGADATGRDLLARVAHGAFATLITATGVSAACLLLGIVFGLFPRLFIGPMEIANALPPMMAGLIVVTLTGPSTYGAALAVMLVSWAPLAAHTAALVEEILARPYVRITPLLGIGRWHRFTGYVLPALIGPVTRHALVRFPGITLALTALGFLGLGQQPPYPEWGRIVAEGMPYIERAPWAVLAPVATLMLLAMLAVSLGQMANGVKSTK